MRKATFVPMEKKDDALVAYEASLTKKQRIDRMFELIEATIQLRKNYVFKPAKNSITLKRKKTV